MTGVDALSQGLKELNISVDEQKLNHFKVYKELLKEWNEKINITAITEDTEIDIKHFIDSLTIFKSNLVTENKKIIDVGTGGGFPGLPIKIVNDKVEVVLLDSLNKRINFLNEVINSLNLEGIKAIHGRAEDFGHDIKYRETFDLAVSRAVASLNILSEYCLPFVKVGGYFIAMKGPEVGNEIEDSKKALKILGGEIIDRVDVKLPLSDISHNLVIIKKVKTSPTKYPRKSGKPRKNPL